MRCAVHGYGHLCSAALESTQYRVLYAARLLVPSVGPGDVATVEGTVDVRANSVAWA